MTSRTNHLKRMDSFCKGQSLKALLCGTFFALALIGCGQGAVPGSIAESTVTTTPPAASSGESVSTLTVRGIVEGSHIEPPFIRTAEGIVPISVPGSNAQFPEPELVTFAGTSN